MVDGHFKGDAYELTGESYRMYGAVWLEAVLLEGCGKGDTISLPVKDKRRGPYMAPCTRCGERFAMEYPDDRLCVGCFEEVLDSGTAPDLLHVARGLLILAEAYSPERAAENTMIAEAKAVIAKATA